MKRPFHILLACYILFVTVFPGHATPLVSNVWNYAVRTYPAYNDPNSPYSEMGVDYNSSGDFESAWFMGGNATATVSPGHMILGEPSSTSSASYTTYFTPEASPVTLAGAGDQLKVTWVFTPSGVNSGSTTASGLRLAVVDSPSASRLTSDGSPGSSTYAGYGMFMNMATTLGSSSPFQLMERSAPDTSSAFLSSSGSWTSLANGATGGNTGYASGTQYTFVMTFTRNAADGLDITATMSGGSLNNTGSASVSYSDSSPNSFTFDTFGLRPSSANDSASSFDTTLFEVEFIPGATAPSITPGDPQDQTVLVGQDATFNVLTSGTLPLSYQWYYNTNTLLMDATNSMLTVSNVQLSDAGAYSVVVTNLYGSATSAVAQLTVNLPDPPSIITQPQDQTVSPGGTAIFTVTPGGSEPFSYQWYFNTNTPLANATDATLTITNVQAGDAGTYSVTVSNIAGGIISSNAILTINTNPVAPFFTSEPVSQAVLIGGTASFTASAAGTEPISYQWNKDSTPIPDATSTTLTLTNVQPADDGSYTVTASNAVGTTTSDPAQLTVTTAIPVAYSDYDLTGFGRNATGGGVLPDTDPNYAKVYTATDLANALSSKTVKIIEIMNDLNLGYDEIEASAKVNSEPFREHTTPLLHPVLLQTGVSLIDIQNKNGLTIFSANGATIRHATFNFKRCNNVIVRNLKFDELWEWDESSKGDYDRNDWDFIDLGNSGTVSNIWVDHCTFTKAYDGIIDIKGGSPNITISWCKYTGDDGASNRNSWVWQQIDSLESNKTSYAFYNFLRTHGFTTTNIVTIIQGHDKTHLIGATTADENTNFSVTLHHEWFMNPWDRLPRLRGGNVHDYNLYVDDTAGLAARRLRDSIAATITNSSDSNALNNTYSFKPFLNGSISTEGGAVLVEKSVYLDCLWPLRDNQTDVTDTNYTGKIEALDTIYQFDNTVIRGNSTDPGNPLGPFQANIHFPFSWNLPGNQLPYTYYPDDPAQLQAILTSPTAGAGAGVLTWAKTNWLITSYAPTAPFIVAHPQSRTVAPSNSVSFTVVAGGSMPLAYQWYFNTNSPIGNATNSTLTLTNVQTTNAGTYSVVVSNAAGSTNSANAILIVGTPNSPPTLFPIADTNINAGVTLVITAVATDTPPQTLTFSLPEAPVNATIDTNSGVFTWRPWVTQANTTNPVTIQVFDNGTPTQSATQSFTVTVNPLAQPNVTPSTGAGGQLRLTVTGQVGPDYAVQASTNMAGWQTIYTTNSPPTPFDWIDTNTTAFPARFYRVVIGPPMP
jgi:pectate lyase